MLLPYTVPQVSQRTLNRSDSPTSCVSSRAVLDSVWLFDSLFSLLIGFCQQSGSRSSTTTHHVMISERPYNKISFVEFLQNSANLGEVRFTFSLGNLERASLKFNIKRRTDAIYENLTSRSTTSQNVETNLRDAHNR